MATGAFKKVRTRKQIEEDPRVRSVEHDRYGFEFSDGPGYRVSLHDSFCVDDDENVHEFFHHSIAGLSEILNTQVRSVASVLEEKEECAFEEAFEEGVATQMNAGGWIF